jgi:hypothetical protein
VRSNLRRTISSLDLECIDISLYAAFNSRPYGVHLILVAVDGRLDHLVCQESYLLDYGHEWTFLECCTACAIYRLPLQACPT